MKNLLKNPGWVVTLLLSALYVFALTQKIYIVGPDKELQRLILLSASFLLPELIFIKFFKGKPRLDNLLITLFLLLLIGDLEMTARQSVILGLSTSLAKTLFRFRGQPILNPAAAGLVIASLLGVLSTWWGISFSPRLPFFNISYTMFLTVPLGIYIIRKYNKWPTFFAIPTVFLLTYYLITSRFALSLVLEGTFAFFVLVMATEPKTSPVLDWQELIYSSFLGVLLSFAFVYRFYSEPYLYTLLLGNLVFFAIKFFQIRAVAKKISKK